MFYYCCCSSFCHCIHWPVFVSPAHRRRWRHRGGSGVQLGGAPGGDGRRGGAPHGLQTRKTCTLFNPRPSVALSRRPGDPLNTALARSNPLTTRWRGEGPPNTRGRALPLAAGDARRCGLNAVRKPRWTSAGVSRDARCLWTVWWKQKLFWTCSCHAKKSESESGTTFHLLVLVRFVQAKLFGKNKRRRRPLFILQWGNSQIQFIKTSGRIKCKLSDRNSC